MLVNVYFMFRRIVNRANVVSDFMTRNERIVVRAQETISKANIKEKVTMQDLHTKIDKSTVDIHSVNHFVASVCFIIFIQIYTVIIGGIFHRLFKVSDSAFILSAVLSFRVKRFKCLLYYFLLFSIGLSPTYLLSV